MIVKKIMLRLLSDFGTQHAYGILHCRVSYHSLMLVSGILPLPTRSLCHVKSLFQKVHILHLD